MQTFLGILNLLLIGFFGFFLVRFLVRMVRNRRHVWAAGDLQSGDYYRQQGDFARALSFYDKAAAVHPEWPMVHHGRAVCLLSLDRYVEAHADATEADRLLAELAETPSIVEAQAEAAQKQLPAPPMPGRPPVTPAPLDLQAIRHLRADSLFIAGICQFRLGLMPTAIQHYNACLEQQPEHPFAWLGMCEALLRDGQLEQTSATGQVRGNQSANASMAANLQFMRLVADILLGRDTSEARELFYRSLRKDDYAPGWPGLHPSTWAWLEQQYPQHVQAIGEAQLLLSLGLHPDVRVTSAVDTPRLVLLPLTPAMAQAYRRDKAAFAAEIQLRLPDDFPVFPESITYWADALHQDPTLIGWASWLMVERSSWTVIGDGGFKGKANEQGEVEIGYALVEAWRGKGYATEFVQGLTQWAFGLPWVKAVTAETLPDGLASQRVLQKAGFLPDGNGSDGPRFRLTRSSDGRALDK